MKSRLRPKFVFSAVIIFAHILFFSLAWYYERIFNGDSFEYILEAINIKDHFFFYSGSTALPLSEEYKTLRTPGYPVFLALIYSISTNNWLVLFFQNILSAINIFYFRKILLEHGYNDKYYWLLLVFITGFPIQFIYANVIAPEILLQTFVLIYFRHVLLFITRKKGDHALKMSLALLFGLFVKPVLYPFAVFHFLMLLIYGPAQRVNWKKCLIAALLPVAGISLYSFWNYERTGKFHFTSIQSFNAIYYYHNYYQAKNGVKAGREFLDSERRKIAALPEFKDRYDYAHERGISLLKDHFFSYTACHLKRSALFFLEPGKGEIDLFTGKMTLGNLYASRTQSFKEVLKSGSVKAVFRFMSDHPSAWMAVLILMLNILKTGGVLLFIRFAKINPLAKWFTILFFAYFALITGPISNTHYVLPVSLAFAGCAVRGFEWFSGKGKEAQPHSGI